MRRAGNLREDGRLNIRWITLRGSRLRVTETGRGDPLVLLNGLSAPLETWRAFVDVVAENRRVVAYDAPGVGASDLPPHPLSIAQLAAHVDDLLSELGYDTADVLGYSHGGAVAQQLAIDHPRRVRRLVLAATTWGMGALPGHPMALWAATARASLAHGSHPATRSLGAAWRLAAISAWSSVPRIRRITQPALVVAGTHDAVVPALNAPALAALLPNGRCTLLPGAGHELFVEPALSRVLDPLMEFLDAGVVDQDCA